MHLESLEKKTAKTLFFVNFIALLLILGATVGSAIMIVYIVMEAFHIA